ncbi:hypothetical protein [Pseudodesulfovibrio pelocollis]|uniref:hypothetical protein n=1 Tax=Pseudodesulfovibrio pelocollis TaxID=3051432 RepID=UPI00255A846F|nr:hypothetical protein [Pseudodesulfovibrio sp. SB368]
MLEALKKTLPMGLGCSIVAAGYAIFMHHTFEENWAASLSSVIGTFVIGTLFWHWLEPAKKRFAIFRGLIIGLGTGWISLYLGVVGGYAATALSEWPSLAVFLQGIIGSVVVTPILIVANGWISISCCGLIGVALTLYAKKR